MQSENTPKRLRMTASNKPVGLVTQKFAKNHINNKEWEAHGISQIQYSLKNQIFFKITNNI